MNTKRNFPQFFETLFWYRDFSKLDLQKDREEIMIQTINYGNWKHWQWLFGYYGIAETKKIIQDIPATAFRKRVLRLIFLILKLNKLKYASRGDRIRAKKSVSKA
jgi:hypothetical protein